MFILFQTRLLASGGGERWGGRHLSELVTLAVGNDVSRSNLTYQPSHTIKLYLSLICIRRVCVCVFGIWFTIVLEFSVSTPLSIIYGFFSLNECVFVCVCFYVSLYRSHFLSKVIHRSADDSQIVLNCVGWSRFERLRHLIFVKNNWFIDYRLNLTFGKIFVPIQ